MRPKRGQKCRSANGSMFGGSEEKPSMQLGDPEEEARVEDSQSPRRAGMRHSDTAVWFSLVGNVEIFPY